MSLHSKMLNVFFILPVIPYLHHIYILFCNSWKVSETYHNHCCYTVKLIPVLHIYCGGFYGPDKDR
jgi:hypothetical protein